jgi:hypothetical protein
MTDGEKLDRNLDVSGGERHRVSRFQHKRNELVSARNADFHERIGSVTRRKGNEKIGNYITSGKRVTSLMSYYRDNGYDLLGSANTDSGANTKLAYLNYMYNWNSIVSDFPADCRLRGVSYLNQHFVVGFSKSSSQYARTTVIKRDRTYSRTLDVTGAPNAKDMAEFGEQLYYANYELNGKRYSDRILRSSFPMDRITFVNGAVDAFVWSFFADDTKYLRVGMRIDIYRSGVRVVDSLQITEINRVTNRVHFEPRHLRLEDNDEIYLEDEKGNFHLYYNDEDYLLIPPVANELPDVVRIKKGNNRLLIWTTNSFRKWDNANLINISETVGMGGAETLRELGNGWFIWADQAGNIWAYNDFTGAFQKISNGMELRLQASKLPVSEWIADGDDNVYSLYIGECSDIFLVPTTTSTSSTSTSSTSTSTSSTSTSSTSTSTVTGTTTSVSSTSTSSTSTSTSSTSTSSTSSSTSTTIGSRRTTYRLRYQFDMNLWSHDTLDRDVTASVVHTHTNGKREIYWGDDSGNVIRKDIGNNDYGLPIPFAIKSIPYDQQAPELIKDYNEIYVFTDRGQSAQIALRFCRPASKKDEGSFPQGIMTPWMPVLQLNDGTSRVRPRAEEDKGNPFYGYYYEVMVTQYDLGDPVVYEGTSCIYTTRRQP